MEDNFVLSEKIIKCKEFPSGEIDKIYTKDVKEFIKIYLKWLDNRKTCRCSVCSSLKIQELAGKELSK